MNDLALEEQIRLCAKQLKIPAFADYTRFLRQADTNASFGELLLELEQSAKRYSVTSAVKPTFAVRTCHGSESLMNSGNQLLFYANTHFAQNRFHFGPHFLNRIEIGTVRRQIEWNRSFRTNHFLHALAVMCAQIVHDNIISLMKFRRQRIPEIFQKTFFRRAALIFRTGKLPIEPDGGENRGGLRRTKGSGVYDPCLADGAPVSPYEVNIDPAFVQKYEFFAGNIRYGFFPFSALLLYIGDAPVRKRGSPSSSASIPVSHAQSFPTGTH